MPNFFDLVNSITPQKGVIISRQERIKREGSPDYDYNLPATAAGVAVLLYVPAQFPLSRKYEPLDFMQVTNNEANNAITIVINGRDSHYCPAGTITTVHGGGVALWQLQITNNGGLVTTLGLVRIKMKKEAMTIDKWSQKQR